MPRDDNPIRGVVPPYIFQKIIENGPEHLRAAATEALTRAEHYRDTRVQMQARIAAGILPRSARPVAALPEPLRRVYNAGGAESLPGTLVRNEGAPPTYDRAADEAYDGAGYTWYLYWEEFGRNAIDGAGMAIDSTVHYGRNYCNAFWNGEQMVYGDGDGEVFDSFTADVDIIAHELSHGVVQYTANLAYEYQSGAMNESMADVFGILTKQRQLGLNAGESDWLLGQNIFVGEEYSMRSMKAPGTAYRNHPVLGDDPQPATMDEYLDLPIWEDRGGVHLNSGIPNHAFYLAAVQIGGNAWEKAGRIWYKTLAERLGRQANFQQSAAATIQVAAELFGAGSLEQQAVQKAWREVKVI